MTSPYATSLLKQTTDGTDSVPRPVPGAQSSRTVVVPQPAPQYATPAQVMMVPARSGSAASSAAMMVIVLLVTLLAGAAGFFIATQSAPTQREVASYQQLAAADGYYAGRVQGSQAGRNFGLESERQIAQYKALIARQKAWNQGYRIGKRTGINRYRVSRRSWYGSGYGYRAPRIVPVGGYAPYSTPAALGTAQAIANSTGQPVDVDVYQ